MTTICIHCDRVIVEADGMWVDPEATGDDEIWRETCDAHDTFIADHEPIPLTCDRCGGEVEHQGNGWWGHVHNFFDAPCGTRIMDRYSVLPYPEEDE